MYKVFFKDRILFLSNSLEKHLLANDFDAIHKYTSHHELQHFIEIFETDTHLKKAILYGRPMESLLLSLKKCFRFVVAAGGLVSNKNEDLLVIHRLGVYDLPKGKAEKGEKPEETAMREVTEECGIEPLLIHSKIGSTFHTYTQKGIRFLKETIWFQMRYEDWQEPRPQTEENIVSAQWYPVTKLTLIKQNTYPSIVEVLSWAGY